MIDEHIEGYNAEIASKMTGARALYKKAMEIGDLSVQEKREQTSDEAKQMLGYMTEGDELKREADAMLETVKRKSLIVDRMESMSEVPIIDSDYGKQHFTPTQTQANQKDLESQVLGSFVKHGNFNEVLPLVETLKKRYVEGSLDETKALTRLNGSDGGFLMMTEFSSEIFARLYDIVQMRQHSTLKTISKSSWEVPTWAHDTAIPARNDNATVAVDSITDAIGKQLFTPQSFGSILKIPVEMLDDIDADFSGFVAGEMAERWGELEEGHFIEGSGVGEPLGILESGLNTTSIIGTANTILEADVRGLPFEISARHRTNGRWLTTRAKVKEIMLLKTQDGGSGLGRFMFAPSMTVGMPAMLDGSPLMETEFMTAPSSTGDAVAVFGNFKQFMIVTHVTSPRMTVLKELYAATNEIGLQFTARVDSGVRTTDAFRLLIQKA